MKWYLTYLVAVAVLGVGALLFLAPYVEKTQTNIALLEQARLDAEVQPPRPTPVPQPPRPPVEPVEPLVPVVVVPQPAPGPTPAAVTGIAPSARSSGKVYTNDDLKPDTRPAHVIMDFTPERANDIDWQAAVKRRGCAPYSFVDADDQRWIRLNCPSVAAH